VTARCIVDDWLVTAGKMGGGEENMCGLDRRLKIWKIHDHDFGPAEEVGLPMVMIWAIVGLKSSRSIAISVMKRGRPMLEIWKKL
jgi:hypothetical protein